jgi:hypothetical protein
MKPYIKQLIAFNTLFIGLLLMGSCKKSDTEGADPTPEIPFAAMTYPKGVPQGNGKEKTIDAAGGSLTSTDGLLTLTVPAGAVSAATVFSILPITNTLPLGTGKAYRILPEGIVLNKPVTISLKYDEASAEGSDEEAYDLVTQDQNGTWKVLIKTTLNKTNRTLTAEVKHLSDFSFTGYYYLVPSKTSLAAGESTTLIVKTIAVDDKSNTEDESPIGAATQVTNESSFEGWEKGGTGTLDAGSKSSATYTAPATADNTLSAEIKATIKNVKRSRNPNGKKVLLRTRLYLQSNEFMHGTYDGQPFTSIGAIAGVGNGMIYITGTLDLGKSILIIVNGSGLGNYSFGDPGQAGKSEIRCDFQENKVFESNYTSPLCPPPPTPTYTVYATGTVSIKSVTNTTVSGDFSGTLYNDDNCTLKSKLITGSFSAKRQ